MLLALDLPPYVARPLDPQDAEALQRLFERCRDYALIVEGQDPSPTAALELFHSLPPRPIAGRQVRLWLD
jgi:hypothetical protein